MNLNPCLIPGSTSLVLVLFSLDAVPDSLVFHNGHETWNSLACVPPLPFTCGSAAEDLCFQYITVHCDAQVSQSNQLWLALLPMWFNSNLYFWFVNKAKNLFVVWIDLGVMWKCCYFKGSLWELSRLVSVMAIPPPPITSDCSPSLGVTFFMPEEFLMITLCISLNPVKSSSMIYHIALPHPTRWWWWGGDVYLSIRESP